MFTNKKKDILNIYFTAGYPILESTNKIIKILQRYCIDIIEVGIPYSDALADGAIIQNSSINSIINGMNLDKLFVQLQCIKKEIYIPIIFMGYYNSFLSFGEEAFLRKCNHIGVSGLISPDIPDYNYIDNYKKLFKKYGLYFIMLITTHTPIERIFYLSSISEGFLYLVSSTSITGKKFFFEKKKDDFFTCLRKKLNIPKLIGFGISNKKMFHWSCFHSEGAIIGSSFIKSIDKYDIEESIKYFIQSIKGNLQE
jgi:tryptophan synthase alpha chain